ncbi:MAG: PAM68 family protein [Leptolyngbyaceae cyanobacterium]
MSADTERERLPFEPGRKGKKSSEAKAATSEDEVAQKTVSTKNSAKSAQKNRSSSSQRDRDDTSIPEAVSRRMLKRMLVFSGVPVSLGVLVFFGGYIVITQHIAELPNVVIFLTTLGCFGLSVVGLSYGALSSSWDEEAVGSLVGIDEFKLNAGRMVDAWRQAREERTNKQP